MGAFNDRSTGAPLAKALESQLTALNYDRRGRGASGDTQPYAVDREVEDLDAPFMVGEDIPRPPKDLGARLAKLVASGHRGEAVELFQTEMVRIPEQVVAQVRHAPFRPALEAIAHTLVYDASIVGNQELPMAKLRSIKTPTLVVYGGESPAFMGSSAKALAEALPDGHVRVLERQSHDIVPMALAPVLLEFFGE